MLSASAVTPGSHAARSGRPAVRDGTLPPARWSIVPVPGGSMEHRAGWLRRTGPWRIRARPLFRTWCATEHLRSQPEAAVTPTIEIVRYIRRLGALAQPGRRPAHAGRDRERAQNAAKLARICPTGSGSAFMHCCGSN